MRFFLVFFMMFFLISSAQADLHFLTISDLHYGAKNKPGDGYDTNPQLLSSALSKFSQLAKKVDFILTLGDFPTHSYFVNPEKEEEIKTVFHSLFLSDPQKPMFYITGNNDSLQGDYQGFLWEGKSPLTISEPWQNACIYCDNLLIDKSHMQEGGYYSSYVIPGNKDVLLIVLNSTQFANLPWYAPRYPNQNEETQKQFNWLEQQLKKEHARQLLIAMHIPPGFNYRGEKIWQDEYVQQFIDILRRYRSHYEQITLLTAHSHKDELRKITLEEGIHVYGISTPSISRIHHNYPGMKIFTLNESLKIQDFTTYYTTSDDTWGDQQYQAIVGDDNIFPECNQKDLVQCLDSMDTHTICKAIEDGLFYGVKSPRVDNSVCKSIYSVN